MAINVSEVRALAVRLLNLTDTEMNALDVSGMMSNVECEEEIPPLMLMPQNAIWAFVRKELARRRARHREIEHKLALEADWNILLDLYHLSCQGKSVSISSACLASGVPPTTALRYLDVLIVSNMIERYSDIEDRRRFYIRFTRKGLERFQATISSQIKAEQDAEQLCRKILSAENALVLKPENWSC
jgi:DNA-binding MarR family transcriptional regulator